MRHKRVCLFGTSADPPTGEGGHLGILKYLASLDDLDEVRIMPVYSHMFGSKRGKQAPFEARVAMCRLLVKDLPKVAVSEVERVCFEEKAATLEPNQSTSTLRVGTADILTSLTTHEPHVDFLLALGADTFIDLASGKWRRTEEVFDLVGRRMVVFCRLAEGGDDDCAKHTEGGADVSTASTASTAYTTSNSNSAEEVEAMDVLDESTRSAKSEVSHSDTKSEDLLRQSIAKWTRVGNEGESTIRLVRIPSLTNASSSAVRRTRDENVLGELLTEDVLKYVVENKMYAFSGMDT